MNYLYYALAELAPTASWRCIGVPRYESVEWLDPVIPMPTKAAVEAEVARLIAEEQATAYQALRKAEYPELADFVDAFYWQQRGNTTLMTNYLANVDAVKAKYPKPGN